MPLTSIGTQKTPGRPIEITFAAETGIPSANQEVILMGRSHSSGSVSAYEISTISNSGDLTAASGEAVAKFGEGSELTKMVLAAVRATQSLGSVPFIKCIGIEDTRSDFGATDEALTEAAKYKGEYLVSPYDGITTDLRNKLRDTAILMSGPHRVENNQFGTLGVVFNRSVSDPSTLPTPDSLYIIPIWLRDTGTGDDAPEYSIGEMAAASAARMAANVAPFNPLDDVDIIGIDAPSKRSDWITVGAALESETALNKGWTPLYVKPNESVSFVRTVTSRLSVDGTGSPVVGAYYDVQDFNVLFFWRKTLFTRFSQPDFKQRKASDQAAKLVLSELIRLARIFEDENMFQFVSQLSKKFQVERNVQDRHRFDYKTPVNVIPGLHVLAGNIEATTEFDELTSLTF